MSKEFSETKLTSKGRHIIMKAWDETKNEHEKYVLLQKYKSDLKVFIDNDEVFAIFTEDEKVDDPHIFYFDVYGYEALCVVLQSLGVDADFV